MKLTALIKFPHVAICIQLDVRTDENTRCLKIDHPGRSLSDHPGIAKCGAIVTQGKAVGA